jgi:hypothetical protein
MYLRVVFFIEDGFFIIDDKAYHNRAILLAHNAPENDAFIGHLHGDIFWQGFRFKSVREFIIATTKNYRDSQNQCQTCGSRLKKGLVRKGENIAGTK